MRYKSELRIASIFALFYFAFFATAYCQQQGQAISIPQIIPSAPEADNLGRYGEIGVGEYTGNPNISIPLHTVRSGKIEFPISLYYNATGIKVNQEATWVGLGWELSAVAGITYIPAEGNDQSVVRVATWNDWQGLIDYINPYKINPIMGTEHIPWGECPYNAPISTLTPGTVIGNAIAGLGAVDLFHVNCMDLSFKFYIHPGTGELKIYGEQQDVKIEKVNTTGFQITDRSGVKYLFLAQEGTPYLKEITCWYLSEIRRPEGDWMKFKYQNFGLIKMIPALSEQSLYNANATVSQGLGYSPRRIHTSTIQNLYLVEIESSLEKLVFNLSANRLDLAGEGARKLDSISVSSKISDSKKTYVFEYSYFDSSTIGANYLNDDTFSAGIWNGLGISEENLRKRLKLVGLKQKDPRTLKTKNYSFEYDETNLLPYKTSFAIDHWGNYNGMENSSNLLNYNGSSHTTIPYLFSIFYSGGAGEDIVTGKDFYLGAARGASSKFITAGTLKSITYPTGGKTIFTFEPHDFHNQLILSAEDEKKIKESISAYTVMDFGNDTGKQAEFRLTEQTEIQFSGHMNNKNGSYNCQQLANMYIRLIRVPEANPNMVWRFNCSDFPSGVYNKTWNETITLQPGIYQLSCAIGNSSLGFQNYVPLVTATVKSRKSPSDIIPTENYRSIGGGLRIKELRNLNSDDGFISSRTYEYTNSDGNSSGKLMVPMSYSYSKYYKYKIHPDDFAFRYGVGLLVNSNNSFSQSTSPVKASIGYSSVTVIDKNAALSNNGKIIKKFINENPMGHFFGNIIMNDASLNGNVATETYFNSNSEIVKVDSSVYESADVERDWINVKIERIVAGPIPCSVEGRMDTEGAYFIGVYPYVRYKNLLKKRFELNYTKTAVNKVEIEYRYDNPLLLQPNGVIVTKSDGSKEISYTTYPDDYPAGNMAIDNMKKAYGHLVSYPIEQVTYKEVGTTRTILSGTITKYLAGGRGRIDQVMALETAAPIALSSFKFSNRGQGVLPPSGTASTFSPDNLYQTRLVYSNYDSYGNPRQITPTLGAPVTYIWSYLGQYPVAEIRNADFATVQSALGGSAAVTSFTGSSPADVDLRSKFNGLRAPLPNSSLTYYTYDPLRGMTSSTDASGRTVWYDYDGFGWLWRVRDHSGNVIEEYKYNYRP
ncbi:hypothetical protein [Parapedobacter tibetensis]|uniref:hypothetical protein n=1 Tax=Parapedobacter tibetensis TaxID=2972951 RepID=UPI00214DE07A|nr:hypothetical protein [Parapedobacter tibetensis]